MAGRQLSPECILSEFGTCDALQQDDINGFIRNMLTNCYPVTKVKKVLKPGFIIFLCHKVVEVFRSRPMLVYVHNPEGVGIIGDLHGSFSNLLKALDRTGWPTERSLVFLGDYVDRGPKTLELIFLLFALQIRFPEHITMLRGNHETTNCGEQYGLFNLLKDEFGPDYGLYIYQNLQNAFDYMPIAAIISDQIYCCHGGISQFASSRDDIAAIQRPTRGESSTMGYVDLMIFTDTLWADPVREGPADQMPYQPSIRGCGYKFTEKALDEKLKQYKVRAIIRGHQPLQRGLTYDFDGKFITVHSTGLRTGYRAAVLILYFDNSSYLNAKVFYYDSCQDDHALLNFKLLDQFINIMDQIPMQGPSPNLCAECVFYMNNGNVHAGQSRYLIFSDMVKIMKLYGDTNETAAETVSKMKGKVNPNRIAAEAFPKLLDDLLASGALQRKEAPKQERPSYEFSQSFPSEPSEWPKFVVMQKYNRVKRRLVFEAAASSSSQ